MAQKDNGQPGSRDPVSGAASDVDASRGAGWTLVVTAKRAAVGKSRLAAYAGEQRSALARAMALDTIVAALASPLVVELIAVTDDPESARAMADVGALVVADEPDAGLNAALSHGARLARERRPDCAVAALQADLPALRTPELGIALLAAATHQTSFVADSAGIGTALYAAGPGAIFLPRFGERSRTAHLASGASELTMADIPSVRQDVDTEADLRVAVELGVGVHTTAVLGHMTEPRDCEHHTKV